MSPKLLEWAAAQVGSTVEAIARKISARSAERIQDGGLTESQAIEFARVTQVPLGYLFLREVPAKRDAPIADFRTHNEANALSSDFFDVYDEIVLKQAWYRDYLIENGAAKLQFVASFSRGKPSPVDVADDMRRVLKADQNAVSKLRDAAEHFRCLAALAEACGVHVLKNGVVGSNSSRRLSARQFRGFVLVDEFAPFVFINGADHSSAWIFTLVHELAHIWRGESGISDAKTKTVVPEERFCNQVAAEFLMPKNQFLPAWKSAASSPLDSVAFVERRFKVSGLAAAVRAHEFGLLTERDLRTVKARAASASSGREESGGNFYSSAATRNGKTFLKTVTSMAMSGQISFREAGRLLNVNPNKIARIHEWRS